MTLLLDPNRERLAKYTRGLYNEHPSMEAVLIQANMKPAGLGCLVR